MTTWNIFDFFSWVDANIKAIIEKMLSELHCIINKKNGWSTFVHAKWKYNAMGAMNFDCTVSTASATTYIIWRLKNPLKTWCFTFLLSNPPTCECGIYQSAFTPCPCMWLAHNKWWITLPTELQRDLWWNANLHERWHPKFHPLYKSAAAGATTIVSLQSISLISNNS